MCSGKSKVSIEEKLCQKNNMRKQGEFCAFLSLWEMLGGNAVMYLAGVIE
jgi:hypothetical protein